MAATSGEDLLKKAVTEAQAEVNPNQVIEIGMIIGLVTAIFEIIKACRTPEVAGAHIQRGSAIANRQMRRALVREGYQGDVREMAAKLVAKGANATPVEIQAVLEESQDVPDAPRLWPAAILAVCLTFVGSAAMAQDSESSGLWPQIGVDVSEIKATVNDLDRRTGNIERDLARLVSVLDGADHAEPTPVPIVEPRPVAKASSGISYRGVAINIDDWLSRYRNVQHVGINGDVDSHLRWHGFSGNFSGLTRSQKLVLHSAAHAGVSASATARAVSRSAPAVSSAVGCENGQCAYAARTAPMYGMRQGLFGNWRPMRR